MYQELRLDWSLDEILNRGWFEVMKRSMKWDSVAVGLASWKTREPNKPSEAAKTPIHSLLPPPSDPVAGRMARSRKTKRTGCQPIDEHHSKKLSTTPSAAIADQDQAEDLDQPRTETDWDWDWDRDRDCDGDGDGDGDRSIDRAEQLVVSSEFGRAKQICQSVLNILPNHLRALETCALCELELGHIRSAKQLFQKCLNHSHSNPPPTVYLYLAQLSDSPQESLSYYQTALDLLRSKLEQSLQSKNLTNDRKSSESNEPKDAIDRPPIVPEDINQPTTVRWSTDESQIRRSCSRALVAMTEIYLTDLCFEPSAEEKCLEYLSMASSIDPTDPEPLQTLASVRLSQSETKLAKEALLLSWSLWGDQVRTDKPSTLEEDPRATTEDEENDGDDDRVEDEARMKDDEDRGTGNQTIDSMMDGGEEIVVIEEEHEEDGGLETILPPLETRIQWAKLAIECEMWDSVIEVLHQCEAEDDENGEVEYLLALSWYLLGQSRQPDPQDTQPDHQIPHQSDPNQAGSIGRDYSIAAGDGLGWTECWLEAKECIETCFQLHERLGDSSEIDESILEHLKQIKSELLRVGIPNETLTGEENQEEEIIDDADWVDASDVEMG